MRELIESIKISTGLEWIEYSIPASTTHKYYDLQTVTGSKICSISANRDQLSLLTPTASEYVDLKDPNSLEIIQKFVDDASKWVGW